MSQAVANSPLFWLALIGGLAVLYLLPILIGLIRHIDGMASVVILTVIPTGVGWLAAMVLACILPRRDPQPVRYDPGIYHY